MKALSSASINDPFLYFDSINPHLLDFDFETQCLISLLTVNVYCCLTCGEYYQGRSKSSHAYSHSINVDHHIFVNLHTKQFYVLPDNYEIDDDEALRFLARIKYAIDPTYTKELVQRLRGDLTSKDLNGKLYSVGFVGLNNIFSNDYSNVGLQLLLHIPQIRDFYLQLTFPKKQALYENISKKSPLNHKFGLLARKLWSQDLFKSQVSPHELLQHISNASKKKFPLNEQKSPKKFLLWLINQLHSQLSQINRLGKTVFSKSLQGSIEITTLKVKSQVNDFQTVDYSVDGAITSNLKFWVLTLSLPPNPLFQSSRVDESGNQVSEIPQVSIYQLLSKYDGTTSVSASSSELKSYKLLSPLPEYLLLHIDRGIERDDSRGNPTVLKYPDLLDFSPYVKDAEGELNYTLVANVKHELQVGARLDHSDDKHIWSISIPKARGEWVTIRDLDITPCQRELMFLDESYLQLWKRVPKKKEEQQEKKSLKEEKNCQNADSK